MDRRDPRERNDLDDQDGSRCCALPARGLLFRATGGYINDFGGSEVWAAGAALEPHVYRAVWLGVSLSAIKLKASGSGTLNFINGEGSYRVSGAHVYGRLAF